MLYIGTGTCSDGKASDHKGTSHALAIKMLMRIKLVSKNMLTLSAGISHEDLLDGISREPKLVTIQAQPDWSNAGTPAMQETICEMTLRDPLHLLTFQGDERESDLMSSDLVPDLINCLGFGSRPDGRL
jgi:hypothetical protein